MALEAMSEIHFRLHFLPFQIKTQINFFSKWLPATILADQNTIFIFVSNCCVRLFYKNLAFLILKNNFQSHSTETTSSQFIRFLQGKFLAKLEKKLLSNF
jgi:hypothetical protein